MKVFAGNARENALPSVQAWFWVWSVTVGGARMVAANVSATDRPLVSVAVTVMFRVSAVLGATPLSQSSAALNVSQPGSAWPFANAAV